MNARVSFGAQVVSWQRQYGRHALPWQGTRDAYRIWVSEIMLQQTQVSTVVPYFERFMARFPDVAALAAADPDTVLSHWSGLGYYSRARYLHRAAQIVVEVHGGVFPRTFEAVASLPGIGRSTAGAIMVFAFGERHPILDGNVKRVLARVCGIAGFPGDTAVANALWDAAQCLLPADGLESYTQGLMDIGATLCRRRDPLCNVCPVSEHCVAFRDGRINELPAPRPRKVLPHRSTVMLILEHQGALLLERRPAPGIWGGLWCFPEIGDGEDATDFSLRHFGANVTNLEHMAPVEHGFTHFSLTISPRRFEVSSMLPRAAESAHQWLPIEEIDSAAIPAPVRRIVAALRRPRSSTIEVRKP
jgi:A/G-specific adenine glycosylase